MIVRNFLYLIFKRHLFDIFSCMSNLQRGFFLAAFLATAFLFFHFALSIHRGRAEVNPHIFYLHIDNDFTKSEKQEIYNAGKLWAKATNGTIQFKFDVRPVEMDVDHLDKMKDTIWRADSNDTNFYRFEFLIGGLKILGYAPPEQYVVIVPENIHDKRVFETVVAHELGHHIGLTHTPAIMDSLARVPCITHFDLEQVCSRYNCSETTKTKLPPTCL